MNARTPKPAFFLLPSAAYCWIYGHRGAQARGLKEWSYSWGAQVSVDSPRPQNVLSPSLLGTGLKPYLYLHPSFFPPFQLLLQGGKEPSKHLRKDLH